MAIADEEFTAAWHSNEKKLTPAEQGELSHLKRMVNVRQDDAYLPHPDVHAKQQLYYAQDELKEYVSVLRRKGRSI